MRAAAIVLLVCLAAVASCSGNSPVFEDRSDEVKIRHRVPSK